MVGNTLTGCCDTIAERLRVIEQESPCLEQATRFYRAVLPALRDADVGAVPIKLTREQVLGKIETGLPLLQGLDLEVDARKVFGVVIELAHALESAGDHVNADGRPWTRESTGHRNPLPETARRLRVALKNDAARIDDLLSCGLNPAGSHVYDLGFDSGLLRALLQNALKVAFRSWGRQLIPLTEGVNWQEDFCPVCGSVPALGELQQNGQSRHLRCGQCGSDWTCPRLRCVYCGNEDHRTLGYFYRESGWKETRVEVCEKCRGYLKVIAAFTPTPAELLPLEDFATIEMDFIARDRGYWKV